MKKIYNVPPSVDDPYPFPELQEFQIGDIVLVLGIANLDLATTIKRWEVVSVFRDTIEVKSGNEKRSFKRRLLVRLDRPSKQEN